MWTVKWKSDRLLCKIQTLIYSDILCCVWGDLKYTVIMSPYSARSIIPNIFAGNHPLRRDTECLLQVQNTMYDQPHKKQFTSELNEPKKTQFPATLLHAWAVNDAIILFLLSLITHREAPRGLCSLSGENANASCIQLLQYFCPSCVQV